MGTIAGNGETDRVSATLDPAVLAELIRLAISLRNQTPTEVAPADVLQSRRDFLRESLGETREADTVFERIIRGDELQPINYLERGAIAARAVARVALAPGGGFGTGFLIAPQVLITNNHVLPDAATAAQATAQFHYEMDLSDAEVGPTSYRLAPAALFLYLDRAGLHGGRG